MASIVRDTELHWKLDSIMKARGITTGELARATGVGHATILRLRSGGVKFIARDTLLAICEYLELQPGDLLLVE